ncbi:hypothetical protein [Paracerasibacillus soli]|uniref:Uncharacterized protein n=1 Tax=Paracerasibacillus soli TaxID=480284 RepID=A0ABU5CVR1_9BACI|nr:hypothetical protein [Virgibacillus soli]MDY0410462.1 hypothetical protein [Virgibacillus soli]
MSCHFTEEDLVNYAMRFAKEHWDESLIYELNLLIGIGVEN